MTPTCSSGSRRGRTSCWGCGPQGFLNKTGEEANAYAVEVVKADFAEAGDEDVIRKVTGDLGALASAEDVRRKRHEQWSAWPGRSSPPKP